MSRHDGPSGRAVGRRDGRCFLATVLTAVTAGCVTGVPSALKKFQKSNVLQCFLGWRPSRRVMWQGCHHDSRQKGRGFCYDGLKRQRPSWRRLVCQELKYSQSSFVFNYTTTTTTTILRPFVRDYPGEPVPEETFTHPPSWSPTNLYQSYIFVHIA